MRSIKDGGVGWWDEGWRVHLDIRCLHRDVEGMRTAAAAPGMGLEGPEMVLDGPEAASDAPRTGLEAPGMSLEAHTGMQQGGTQPGRCSSPHQLPLRQTQPAVSNSKPGEKEG